eukprot:312201-Prorocentrum_minimum.AAC.2
MITRTVWVAKKGKRKSQQAPRRARHGHTVCHGVRNEFAGIEFLRVSVSSPSALGPAPPRPFAGPSVPVTARADATPLVTI